MSYIFLDGSSSHSNSKTKTADYYVNESGDKMFGNLDMGNQNITNINDPENDGDATNKKYCEDNYINASGDKMTGDLNMNNHRIINTLNPINDYDVVNKKSMNDSIDNIKELTKNVSKTSEALIDKLDEKISNINKELINFVKIDTDINLNNHRILNIPRPEVDHEAVNKQFVTDEIKRLWVYIGVKCDTLDKKIDYEVGQFMKQVDDFKKHIGLFHFTFDVVNRKIIGDASIVQLKKEKDKDIIEVKYGKKEYFLIKIYVLRNDKMTEIEHSHYYMDKDKNGFAQSYFLFETLSKNKFQLGYANEIERKNNKHFHDIFVHFLFCEFNNGDRKGKS